MKINKYISLDEDLFQLLSKETNASSLINEQLRVYYALKDCENLNILEQNLAEIKQKIKENRRKEKELVQKINKITQKNKDFFANFKKSYPDKLIEKLNSYDNLDYETARDLAIHFDLHKRGIGGVKLIKVWEELKKNAIRKQ